MNLYDHRTSQEEAVCPQPRFETELQPRGTNLKLASIVAVSVEETVRAGCLGRVSIEWKLLLGTITYSYARGIYLSEEIESAVEETHLGLKLGHLGSAEAIRELRRYHRGTLEHCLSLVLQGTSANSVAEAKARIDRAIRIDSYALDF